LIIGSNRYFSLLFFFLQKLWDNLGCWEKIFREVAQYIGGSFKVDLLLLNWYVIKLLKWAKYLACRSKLLDVEKGSDGENGSLLDFFAEIEKLFLKNWFVGIFHNPMFVLISASKVISLFWLHTVEREWGGRENFFFCPIAICSSVIGGQSVSQENINNRFWMGKLHAIKYVVWVVIKNDICVYSLWKKAGRKKEKVLRKGGASWAILPKNYFFERIGETRLAKSKKGRKYKTIFAVTSVSTKSKDPPDCRR